MFDMNSSSSDKQMEMVGTIFVKTLPITIPGGLVALWYFRPDIVNPILEKILPYIQQAIIYTIVTILIITTLLIVRFLLNRYREKKNYYYYRILPHTDQKTVLKTVTELVEQFAGYGRPSYVRVAKGREWFQWLITKEQISKDETGICFYIGFPKDRHSGVIRSLENAYPQAEFHKVDSLPFPSKKAVGGRMVSFKRGIDSALPFKHYNGEDGTGNLISYMRKGTWIDLTFSPSSHYVLMRKLRKSQKKMKKTEKKYSNMDSFEKERFKDISKRLNGRDKVFTVSISIAAEGKGAEQVIYPLSNSLNTIMADKNGLQLRKMKDVIKKCPYPLHHKHEITGRELSNLLHLPDPEHKIMNEVPHLSKGERLLAKDELSEGFKVGDMKHPVIKNRPVKITPKVFKEHFAATGKTGAGKSSLLVQICQSFIDEWVKDSKNAPGFTLFDPAQEAALTIINRLLTAEAKGADIDWDKVHYISLQHSDHPVSLNLLYKAPGTKNDAVKDNFVALLNKAFDNKSAPRMLKYLENIVLSLLEDKQQHNVLGIMKMLTDPEFRNKVIVNVKDPILKEFWNNTLNSKNGLKEMEQVKDTIYNRMSPFQTSVYMRRMFGQNGFSLDIKRWMDEGHIILIDIKDVSEVNKTLTIGHMVTQYHQIAQSRKQKNPKLHEVLIDESHLVQIPILSKIFAEDRKFGLGLGLFTQHMNQFEKWLLDDIKGILSTIFTGRSGYESARLTCDMTGERFDSLYLQSLPDRNTAVYSKRKGANGTDEVTTCTIVTEPPYVYLPSGEAAVYEKANEMSAAFSWAEEKAKELQKRDGDHFNIVDEKIVQYLGVGSNEVDEMDDFFKGGEAEVQLEKTPEPVEYSGAVEFIKDTGYATTSLLQRRYKIGHTQAARLIDRMEAEGVIGPYNGSSPRVLLNGNGEKIDNSDPTPEMNEDMDNELPGIAESKPLGENVTEEKEKELEEGKKAEEPAPFF